MTSITRRLAVLENCLRDNNSATLIVKTKQDLINARNISKKNLGAAILSRTKNNGNDTSIDCAIDALFSCNNDSTKNTAGYPGSQDTLVSNSNQLNMPSREQLIQLANIIEHATIVLRDHFSQNKYIKNDIHKDISKLTEHLKGQLIEMGVDPDRARDIIIICMHTGRMEKYSLFRKDYRTDSAKRLVDNILNLANKRTSASNIKHISNRDVRNKFLEDQPNINKLGEEKDNGDINLNKTTQASNSLDINASTAQQTLGYRFQNDFKNNNVSSDNSKLDPAKNSQAMPESQYLKFTDTNGLPGDTTKLYKNGSRIYIKDNSSDEVKPYTGICKDKDNNFKLYNDGMLQSNFTSYNQGKEFEGLKIKAGQINGVYDGKWLLINGKLYENNLNNQNNEVELKEYDGKHIPVQGQQVVTEAGIYKVNNSQDLYVIPVTERVLKYEGKYYKNDTNSVKYTLANGYIESKYYKDGEPANGVMELYGTKNCFKNGEAASGIQEYEGKKYIFNEYGCLQNASPLSPDTPNYDEVQNKKYGIILYNKQEYLATIADGSLVNGMVNDLDYHGEFMDGKLTTASPTIQVAENLKKLDQVDITHFIKLYTSDLYKLINSCKRGNLYDMIKGDSFEEMLIKSKLNDNLKNSIKDGLNNGTLTAEIKYYILGLALLSFLPDDSYTQIQSDFYNATDKYSFLSHLTNKVIQRIESSFVESTQETDLFRGHYVGEKEYNEGDIIYVPGFSSWSLDGETSNQGARRFADQDGHILLKMEKNNKVRSYPVHSLGEGLSQEQEVLLPTGMKYKIKQITGNSWCKTYIVEPL